MRNDCQKGNPSTSRRSPARQDEDDRRERAGRRRDRLHDVVLEDRRVLERARTAIEITAAGIDEAKVSPTRRPR
jgi:hypothetical protein